MAAWNNWIPPGMEYLAVKRAAAGLAGAITHVSQCDDETKWSLRQWVEAKRSKDFATADPIRDALRVKRIDPDKICAQDLFHEWSPLIMHAQKPLSRAVQLQLSGGFSAAPSGFSAAPAGFSYPMGGAAFNQYPIDPRTQMPMQPTQMTQGKRSLQPSRSYEELDDFTKQELDMWLEHKRNHDFAKADGVRLSLRNKNVEPDTVMIETNWLKKHRPNTWAPAAEEDAGPTSKVIRLTLPPTANLCMQGYVDPLPAIEFRKEQTALSESTWILQEFFENDSPNKFCSFQHDPDAQMFPDVYNAWKARGNGDSCITIATCPSLQKAAVGFGGKKNGERAAKLALCVALAGCHPRAEHVLKTYPSLAAVLRAEENLQSGISLMPSGGLTV